MYNSNLLFLREALEGFDIVIVGGDARDEQTERLHRIFGLRRVVHRTTRQGDPTSRAFEAALHGPRVVLAIWLCGQSRTNHGKHFRAICKERGIPWFDCPHVPHPNRVVAKVDELQLIETIIARRAQLLAELQFGGAR